MKRTNTFRRWLHMSGWFPILFFAYGLTSGLFSSCEREGLLKEGTPLPKGKYPLQLSAEMLQPQTRSGGKETWIGGEEIGVLLDGLPSHKKYVIDASGKADAIDSANTIYWQNTAEAHIQAWYPYEIGPYVDISDQSAGYTAFDVLYAQTTGYYKQPVNLSFNHQMAKIEYSLVKGEGITDEELNNATVTIFGDAEAYISTGRVGTADQTDGEIKPYYNMKTKKGEALIVPQNMKNKPLFKVSINSNTFVYQPETDAAGNFKASYQYSYTIIVKADELEVQAVSGNNWKDGGEENVSVITHFVDYTASDVKTGDYIYSDGTTSDGGLRKRYFDGREPIIANPKPQPKVGKTVVGVVFWTPKDTDATGRQTPASLTDDKIMAKDHPTCIHGLAVSLKHSYTIWQKSNEDIKDFQDGTNFTPANKADYVSIATDNGPTDNINRILGYQNTQVLLAYNTYCRNNGKNKNIVKPVEALASFSASNPAPANSTGWYIPSAKEFHILCFKDVDDIWNYYKKSSHTETGNIVNASISEADGDLLGGEVQWSSSECAYESGFAFDISFFKRLYVRAKDNNGRARAVCAF